MICYPAPVSERPIAVIDPEVKLALDLVNVNLVNIYNALNPNTYNNYPYFDQWYVSAQNFTNMNFSKIRVSKSNSFQPSNIISTENVSIAIADVDGNWVYGPTAGTISFENRPVKDYIITLQFGLEYVFSDFNNVKIKFILYNIKA